MTRQATPTVSIILPTYNCTEYVGEAIESMLRQSFTEFELIVIDDGSKDDTLSAVRRYDDPRMQVHSQSNRGLAATLNRGIGLARGRYIARQDQDDVSLPERLGKQVAYLEAHPNCGLLGTWAEIWQERRRTERAHRHPADNASLKFELLLNNPFVHSSVMIRKAVLERVGGYSTESERQPPEDFELWSRIARESDVANLPEFLHRYREIVGSMSRHGPSPFLDHLVSISAENVAWASGEPPNHPQVVNIAALAHGARHRLAAKPDFVQMARIFQRAAHVVASGGDKHHFKQKAAEQIAGMRARYLGRRHPRVILDRFIQRVWRTAGRLRGSA